MAKVFMDSKTSEHVANCKDLPNTDGQDAVVHQTGTTVAHSVPVRGAANKPISSDRTSDASLCSADLCTRNTPDPLHPHHAKSGQGSGDGDPGGGAAAERVTSLDPIQTNRNKQLRR